MKQYFLKISGLAAIILLLHGTGFSQDDNEKKDKVKIYKSGDNDEIIIKRKSDKDSKVTVEVKDGQVFINGKPVDEFEDDNLSIHRRNADDDFFTFAPRSPFRGGVWNFDSDVMESKSAFLGVVSEKAESGGAEITEISKESAAEKIGLKKGDIITKIDDTKIEGPDDLMETIRMHKPEDKVVVTYKRDGKEEKATAVLGKFKMNYNFKMPKVNNGDFNVLAPGGFGAYSYSSRSGSPKIGIKAQDVEDGKGVKVLDVDEESPADKAGIKEDDVITQFDGKEINDVSQLAEFARAAKTKSSIKVKLNRAGKSQEVEIKIPKKLKTADL